MNKNEQLIQKIAEEMANSSITCMHVNGDYETGGKLAIAFYKEAARIAVDHIKGELALLMCESGWDLECADKYLLKRGLIPPTEKEVTNE